MYEDQGNGSHNLAIRYTEDTTKKGDYPITYEIYHDRYPINIVERFEAFVWRVVDPCDVLVILEAAANLED